METKEFLLRVCYVVGNNTSEYEFTDIDVKTLALYTKIKNDLTSNVEMPFLEIIDGDGSTLIRKDTIYAIEVEEI